MMMKAAAGSTDITPSKRIPLIGSSARLKPFEKVDDPLEVNALLLDDGHTRVAIVSADLLFIGDGLRQRILSAIELPLSLESLLLAASHTHYAPMTLDGMPKLGVVDESYVDSVAKRTASLIDSLAAHLRPVALYYGEGDAKHSINRRVRRLRVWRNGVTWTVGMGLNWLGARDETVRLLRLVDQDGGCVCAAWNYACHPSSYPWITHVSAEYPGRVRSRLRSHLGWGVPVLFFQGFSGDVRPPFAARVRSPISLLRRLCLGPIFGTPTEKVWDRWAESLTERVLEVYSLSTEALAPGELRTTRVSVPMFECISGGQGDRAMTLHIVTLGRGFCWVGLGAEVAVAYRHVVEGVFPGYRVFSVGCIDHVRGYLPTDAMIQEGGYEVVGFRKAFAFDGQYKPGVEAKVQNALKSIVAGDERPRHE